MWHFCTGIDRDQNNIWLNIVFWTSQNTFLFLDCMTFKNYMIIENYFRYPSFQLRLLICVILKYHWQYSRDMALGSDWPWSSRGILLLNDLIRKVNPCPCQPHGADVSSNEISCLVDMEELCKFWFAAPT